MPQHSSNRRKFCRWTWKLGLNTWSQPRGSNSSSPGIAGPALPFHCSPSLLAVTSGGKIISAEGERLCWESLKMTNLRNLSSILGRREHKLTLSRDGSRMSQSLKSPSADSLKVQGGAGIPGCSEIATGFSVLRISFPIKSSKIPQFLYLHVRICRTTSFVCFHQELVWKESKERFCREAPNNSNQTQWVGPLGIQCPPQGHPKLLAGSVPNPHARSGQAVPPNPCVHAGAGISTQGTQFHGLSVPAGTPRAQPYTNSVKSSTEEISLFLCPVS